MTHVIDRDGRHAARFHGLGFQRLNLVLYVNGLIDNWYAAPEAVEPGWWERLRSWFR